MRKYALIGFLMLALTSFGQSTQVGRSSNAIDRLIGRYHYQAKPLDDSLSSYLFWHFIEAIDPSGYYFLEGDIERLQKHEFEIDDQIGRKTSEFFDEAALIYFKRLESADSIIDVLLSKPFDFTKDEYILYTEGYDDFVADYDQLTDRWRKWLKSSILEELFEGDFFANAAEQSIDSLMRYIPDAAKIIKAYEKFEISSYTEHPSGYVKYLATFFLDAMAGYYDPHTTYFSGIDKEQFEADLSKENYAYGFSLYEDEKGKILIGGLTPGGSAWMSNSINQDDVLLKVRFDKGKAIDVSFLTLDQLMLLFESVNSEYLVLTLQKANGMIEDVSLVKSEVYVAEDVIKSVILEGDKKIGYIILPDFYTDWDDTEDGLGCANDIAKNIVKLKQENIDGLILDLRNNGGGSLKEAIDLAGIFIDWGPICVEQGKYREPKTIKDMNKGAIYTGPLVIMVNGLSASASEIFSAAMQDYNRALILGSQTYGKSTGQVVMPLDPSYNKMLGMTGVDEDFGYLKVTQSKFYRVTNETHQKEGVVPDIVLRDYYELYDYAERLNETALEKDKIEKKMYYKPFPEFSVSKLQSNSDFRMSMNIFYQELCTVLDSINNFDEYYDKVPLNLEKYRDNERIMNKLYEQLFTGELKPSEHFKVVNNKFDLEIMKMNDYRAKLNEEYLLEVSKDLYIGEAYNVLVDLIESKQ